MNDDKKTKKQLIEELTILRRKTAQIDNPKNESEKKPGSLDYITGQVQESMEQLILALDASDNGLFDWNMKTGEAYFSPRYYTMLGYEPDEFPASFDSWIDMIVPEDREGALKTVSEYNENKTDSHRIEYRMRTKTGGEQWILSKGRMFARDETGKPVRMVGTHSDIAARKLAEKTLAESEEKFRTLSDSSPLGIFQTGRDGDVVYLNDRWCSITGMSREDAMGFGWTQALHPDDKPRILTEWEVCLKEKKGYDGEFRFVRSSGEIRWVYTKTSPLFSADGEVIGHVGANEDITDRKNTERILVKEKEFTETALNAQQDTFFVFDPTTGKAIRWNKSFRDVSGYTDAEIAENKAPDSYYSAEDLEKAAEVIKKILEGKKATIIIELITKDGRRVPTEYLSSAILDDTGKPQFLISVGRDITKRKRVEDLLKIQRDLSLAFSESSDLKQLLLELLNAAFRMEGVDAGGVYLRNPDTGELDIVSHQGLPEEFIASASHYDGDTPQAQLIAKGEPIHGHYQKLNMPIDEKRKNEALKAISIIPFKHEHKVIGVLNLASHTFDEFPSATHDAIESIAGIIGESLARAQAESLLRESEERYRIIIDRVGDVIWKIDQTGKTIFVTPSVENLLGYSVDEYMACDLDQIIDKQSRIEADRVMAEMFKKNDSSSRVVEQELICKDGTRKTCEVTFSLLTDSVGQPSGLIGVTRDISQRKAIEDKLRQSEKMEAIGQLAGGVAHDFNNQLAGILGYADLLREEVSNNQELTRYADNILIGVKRAADLTSQLLAFSRQGKYQTTTVNFHRIIFEVVNILGHTIDKRISVRQELTANPATTLGDPTQLQNAVLNLALNARDAMPTGGELTFSTEVVDLDEEYCENNPYKIIPGKYLKVCITDTGTGMDEETTQHIFEPFFTTKELGKGTGMGLAAVYGTVKNHNGAINVYSEPGKGTTFTVYLPLYVEDGVELGKDLQTTSIVKGSAHVLLVEDEDIVRAAAAEMMEKLGYTVSVCSNGAEAVSIYQKSWQSIDLLIIDMVMPEMNGKDAFIAMREINPAIVALLASGYSLNGEARTILDEGVQGFIQKPFRKNELSQKIAEVLTSNN